ncbi:MAG: 3-dehydroquinate synthase [Pyrinomonadaceae bacterium]
MHQRVNVKTKREAANYSIRIGVDLLDQVAKWASELLGPRCKIAIISNKKVFGFYGQQIANSLNAAGFTTEVHLIGDGEHFKNLKSLMGVLDSLSSFGISRSDAVLGLGGGVVGDLAAFAASIHLRGVDYLSVPTTLLSMVDSSVGGKTGINTEFGKNQVGTFFQPKGVLIDPKVLVSLPKREMTAGFCECIKQAAISGNSMLRRTRSVIEQVGESKFSKLLQNNDFTEKLEEILALQVAFKAKIVAGDERESIQKTDSRSRKILNFGHTFAHALEKATDYSYLKHGEAVGYGIIFASALSEKLGLLDMEVVNLLRDVVHRAGILPSIFSVDSKLVFEALRHDKKVIGSDLQWVLLKGIGNPAIVPHNEIGDRLVFSTIKEFTTAN